MNKVVVVAGFFPPPITGQGLATARLAELLSGSYEVICVNLREGEKELDLRLTGRIFQKISSYKEAGQRLSAVLESYPNATVLWTAISPEKFGHMRDLLTIVPTFKTTHKVYGIVHWGRFSKVFRSALTRATALQTLKKLEGVVFLNENRADDCRQWIASEKRIVIPNILDEAVVCSDSEIKRKQEFRNDPIRLLFLGHMIKEKGYLDTLEAVRILHSKGIPLHATFAGQWMSVAERQFFEQTVTDNDLQNIVAHLGPVNDRTKVKELHLKSDVFVLPSYMIEGQPLSIIEAMNAASPIVTTQIGGTVDMVTPGNEGFFVEQQAPEQIANVIEQIKENWLFHSQAARARYLTHYNAESIVELWKALI